MEYPASHRTGSEWEGQHCKNTVTQSPYVPVPPLSPLSPASALPTDGQETGWCFSKEVNRQKVPGAITHTCAIKEKQWHICLPQLQLPNSLPAAHRPSQQVWGRPHWVQTRPRVSSAKVTGLSAQRGMLWVGLSLHFHPYITLVFVPLYVSFSLLSFTPFGLLADLVSIRSASYELCHVSRATCLLILRTEHILGNSPIHSALASRTAFLK